MAIAANPLVGTLHRQLPESPTLKPISPCLIVKVDCSFASGAMGRIPHALDTASRLNENHGCRGLDRQAGPIGN